MTPLPSRSLGLGLVGALLLVGRGCQHGLLSTLQRAFNRTHSGTAHTLTMHRRFLKELRGAFPTSADEYNRQVERLLRLRRAEMDAAWAALEKGWVANNERVITLKVRPRTNEENVVRLNVGGSKVTLLWHLLAETEGFEDSILFALLEGVWDKERIPRDADGRIVLDESPACINRIIHTMANGRASLAMGLPESAVHSAVAIDEVPCLVYTAHVMELPVSEPKHPKFVKMNGGSTVLEPFEIAPLGSKIREWVGDSCTEHLTLIYRATRDGFDTKSFKPGCSEDSTSHVISLVRVTSGKGNDDDDSIVGGYSTLQWGARRKYTITKKTFLFMLKDGCATRKGPGKPRKWDPNPEKVGVAYTPLNPKWGACVGGDDMATWLDETSEGCILSTGRTTFGIEKDSPLLALDGKKVVDIEVYRCSKPATPATTAPNVTKPGRDAEAHDIESFGRSIARSLMEERVVLNCAVKEMEAAGARVSAAVDALRTVYGPSVAAGEQDTVVELNVRGVIMTTLRSTLQACPSSALATMSDAERWPPADKDKDKQGRRLVDCDPNCFSKILDVLRMRKRASWGRGVEGRGQVEKEKEEEGAAGAGQEKGEEESSMGGSGAVLIKTADVEAFGAAVNMYFPGYESFIMDMVQSV